jgi:hypothetical protein
MILHRIGHTVAKKKKAATKKKKGSGNARTPAKKRRAVQKVARKPKGDVRPDDGGAPEPDRSRGSEGSTDLVQSVDTTDPTFGAKEHDVPLDFGEG